MKKFTSITGQKAAEEPKKEPRKISAEEAFKLEARTLMEDLLSISTHGPIDRYLRAGSIKIEGKEEFLEALASMAFRKSAEEKEALLESLKAEVADWKSIDDKKAQVAASIGKSVDPSSRRKIASLLERWGSDEETLRMVAEKHASRLGEASLKARAEAARLMAQKDASNSGRLEMLANIFESKI